MPLTVSDAITPEVLRVLSENLPIAIPVRVPLVFFVPANILGVITLCASITVFPLFQSATQSKRLESTPALPGAPVFTLNQLNEVIKV